MAVQTITYDDKQYLNQNSNIPDINKINDTDMNMIKSVVNNNATELTNLINNLTILTGSFTLASGKSEFTINYPTGFTSINCIVISCMLKRQQGYTEGFFPTNTGYLSGALGKIIQLKDEEIRLVFCNPNDASTGTESYDYQLALLKIN